MKYAEDTFYINKRGLGFKEIDLIKQTKVRNQINTHDVTAVIINVVGDEKIKEEKILKNKSSRPIVHFEQIQDRFILSIRCFCAFFV